MTEEKTEPAPGAIRQYVRWAKGWKLQEAFWKEVTTRTIAAVIAGIVVAAIIYLWALAFGYLQTPEGPRTVANTLGILAFLSIFIVGPVYAVFYFRTQKPKHPFLFWFIVTWFWVSFLAFIGVDVATSMGWIKE